MYHLRYKKGNTGKPPELFISCLVAHISEIMGPTEQVEGPVLPVSLVVVWAESWLCRLTKSFCIR